MNYECEADYNASMAAQAEAEYNYYQGQEQDYNNYLDSLIESKQYKLYAIEVCMDLLNLPSFKESGLPANEFLNMKRVELMTPSINHSNVETIQSLPF